MNIVIKISSSNYYTCNQNNRAKKYENNLSSVTQKKRKLQNMSKMITTRNKLQSLIENDRNIMSPSLANEPTRIHVHRWAGAACLSLCYRHNPRGICDIACQQARNGDGSDLSAGSAQVCFNFIVPASIRPARARPLESLAPRACAPDARGRRPARRPHLGPRRR